MGCKTILLTFLPLSFIPIVLSEDCVIASRGLQGRCLSLQHCLPYVALTNAVTSGALHRNALLQLRNVACGFEGNTPRYCCAFGQITSTFSSTARSFVPQVTNQPPTRVPFNSPNIAINLPSPGEVIPTLITVTQSPVASSSGSCGTVVNPDRIVGGKEAVLGAWPWMAVLFGSYEVNSIQSPFCGGSLVSSRYVITAAHCIPPAGVHLITSVRLGEHDLDTNIDCEMSLGRVKCLPAHQSIRPQSVSIHPEYDRCRSQKACNDIALIRLEKEAVIGDYVRPICLPVVLPGEFGFTSSEITRRKALVAGWGNVNKRAFDISLSTVLKDAEVKVRQECRQSAVNVLCADGDEQGTCIGDSGGPLMMINRAQTKFFLLGITSSGSSICASPDSDVRYTDVKLFIPWIQRNIR